ncbi:hypothetical protein B0T25DRAFT_572953 [Lasiosphaeria hispida]|uniref:Chromo domain-containing protein n=1 Tax=Lasiosphaeria hispida TaxID=260671 RepID=A0AAJ0M9G2_9PEZI|nr:hypothetical protein B0T25DRAFT_572953 [Lasiosphaeria hispida]
MFKQVGRRPSLEAFSPNAPDSDDDISLTSTVDDQHDSDEEFSVEGILAEQKSNDGDMYYLVEWTGFSLHRCTWEPETNLGDELKAIWEVTKRRQKSGDEPAFELNTFYEARHTAAREKEERHRRRNAKRMKKGLPLTSPFPESPTATTDIDDLDSSDEEAAEDAYIEEPVPAPASSKPHPRPKQQRIFSGNISSSTSADAVASGQKAGASPVSRNQSKRPSSTGYQGTARKLSGSKPSTSSAPLAPRSAQASGSSIPRPSTNMNSRPVKGVLTAKRSAVAKRPASNIFSGGKMRKPRQNLAAVMSDPTKEPKFFEKARFRRIAEKGSRDKEDRAPDFAVLQAMQGFDISRGPTGRTSKETIVSPTFLPGQESSSLPMSSKSAGELRSVSDPRPALVPRPAFKSQDSILGGGSKKERKFVRFLDESENLVQDPEPMDIDMPAARLRFKSPPPSKKHSLNENLPPPPKKLSLNEYLPKLFHSSEKKLILGKNTTAEVFFNGLPRESEPLTDFLAGETLDFGHTCLAQSVQQQLQTLIQMPLATGTITPKPGSESRLEEIAEFLRSRLLGLYHPHPSYNILVYPTKCDEWKMAFLGSEPPSPSDVALRYFIFASTFDCSRMLRPLTLPMQLQTGIASEREIIMKRFFNFDFDRLLPARAPGRTEARSFFLVFPESRGAMMQALYHWLRACKPDCQIYTNHNAGSWKAFRANVENAPGVVIVHELLTWSLRRFPRLAFYLIKRLDQYWCLSEPVQPYPIYPSISTGEGPLPPGSIQLNRLFPGPRTAILLSPSFLVSEPQRADELFEWFLQNWAKRTEYRLVTASNISDYLMELALEKSEERDSVRARLDSSSINMEIEANLRGLSQSDCELRFKVAAQASELDHYRTRRAGLYGEDEDSNSSLIYADPAIDPNDEQSLVNWFGWWSTMRADQFRKFYVVGSSSTIGYPGSRRGQRLVRIPTYTRVTINYPDLVLDTYQQTLAEHPPKVKGSSSIIPQDKRVGVVDTQTQTADPGPPWTFKSDLIKSDSAFDIEGYIQTIFNRNPSQKWSPWTLYRYPVYWANIQMADKFGGFRQEQKRIKDWFDFTWSFSSSRNKHFNTYIGFFYTVADGQDPQNLPKHHRLRRDPWLAIYRPVNPHMGRPFTRCEVIIWDPTAKMRFPGAQEPAERDLFEMQRRVVEYIREHGPALNPETWIDQVWLGGFDSPGNEVDPSLPFDSTMHFLERLLGNIREFLPAFERHLPKRGFKKVHLSDQATRPNGGEAEDVPMDLDDSSDGNESDEGGDTRIIFHPPRGAKVAPGQKSKCTNKLHEDARLARARSTDSSATHMPYQFRPTLDWYGEQRAEGRNFEHINVDCWESIFNYFRIGKSAALETSTASTSDRRDSTASA